MKYIKHGEINELEAVHKRCSYIASCPEGDYCIELVEAPLSGIFCRISAVGRNKPKRSKDCLLQCRPLRVLRICKQEGPSSPYP